MSDAYDPRQELNPSSIIVGGLFLVVLGFATVAFIIWGNAPSQADASAEMASQ